MDCSRRLQKRTETKLGKLHRKVEKVFADVGELDQRMDQRMASMERDFGDYRTKTDKDMEGMWRAI